MPDLFGEEVVLVAPPAKGRKRVTGYPAAPGTGPAGETCATCQHILRTQFTAKRYIKCGHPMAHRSHSAATDIRARAPACRFHLRATPSRTEGRSDG